MKRNSRFIHPLLVAGLVLAAANFHASCGKSKGSCGDGKCGSGESNEDCPEDCTVCGDGVCGTDEDPTNCPEDCGCGNGVLQPDLGEICDGMDFGGLTCLDSPFHCEGGMLSCSTDCTTISGATCSRCPSVCGDGEVGGTEECDCGTDPTDLPADCTSINAAPPHNGECNDDCTWNSECGNGVVEGGEECDCGINPHDLPPGCSAVNGDIDGECQTNCRPNVCEIQLWSPDNCNPTTPEQCCPDEWGNDATCVITAAGYGCVLACTTTDDCYYDSYCHTQVSGCFVQTCGPGGNGGNLNEECQVPGGGLGFCVPIASAQDGFGLCFENSPNALPPGAECTEYEYWMTFPRDVGLETCEYGICDDIDNDGVFHCFRLCNWEDVYDNDNNAAVCPAGTNCWTDSSLDSFYQGNRSADLSYCHPTEQTDPLHGTTACDLLTGELIADRTRTCSDVHTWWACRPRYNILSNGTMAPGSLIGRCADYWPSGPGYWESCQPMSDACPSDSDCFPEDFCSQPSVGPYRCIPFCDTNDPNPCANQHPQVPATNVCHSFSTLATPSVSSCTTTDGAPTRLGLCGCPAQGCVP